MDVSRYDITYDAQNRNEGNSLFTETFSDDSIILYNSLQNVATKNEIRNRDCLDLTVIIEG